VSSTYIPVALRRLVEARAGQRCEYCWLPAELAFLLPHEVDHVIAEKHGGDTVESTWPSPAGAATGTRAPTSPPSTRTPGR
jgi:hypothetical protein